MSISAVADKEPNSTSTLPELPGVLVTRKHHLLVRWSHWLNVPILLERRLDLLGVAGLSTRAGSKYGKLRCGGGYWNLDMRPRSRTASLQQSTRLDLQPRSPALPHVWREDLSTTNVEQFRKRD
jgi:hypothetical protein